MRNQVLRHFALLSVFILTGVFSIGKTFAQERIPVETTETMDHRDKMAAKDYHQDVNSRYEKIMSQVERMKRQMEEKKMDNPKFRKSLNKFEAHATSLHERMQNADTVPAEKQEAYRKKMRSELTKLNKEYNKLVDRWEKMNAENKPS
jgi:hypothetical protein